VFTRSTDGTCTMEVGAPTVDVLVARILWLGVDFDILASTIDLRSHMRRIQRRLVRAASAPRK